MNRIEKQVYFDKLTEVCEFVNLASRYDCDIKVRSSSHEVDGKSILGILALALWKPVTVSACGTDAHEFADKLTSFQPH
ncbi:MAG: HPr family phosphocarrier protein [Clostridiales bacterium]|jgi:phosphocarrier protein HPr|nr:HPr family phosphocarrier protein [Clostridiales bacterium]